MANVRDHSQQMEQAVSDMEAALAFLKKTAAGSASLRDTWEERKQRIDEIEVRGWSIHQGGEIASAEDRQALEALRESAVRYLAKYTERTEYAKGLVQEMESRIKQARSSKHHLNAHMLKVDSAQGPAGPEEISAMMGLIQDTRAAVYKAHAFIEIEAGSK